MGVVQQGRVHLFRLNASAAQHPKEPHVVGARMWIGLRPVKQNLNRFTVFVPAIHCQHHVAVGVADAQIA
jgi:hypothetical protein